MSKVLKGMMMEELRSRLKGVDDALLVDVIGLNSGSTYTLRRELRNRNISLLVVKRSLARKAFEGRPLAQVFEGGGSVAVVWGGEDFVSLAKELVAIHKKPEFEKCQARGGLMDGERLTPDRVEDVSKWPSRLEQISILLGQILGTGGKLLSQINAPGGMLVSQIKKKSEEEAEAAA